MEKVNELKPQWKDAPEWARFLACSSFFGWYWYEVKPELHDGIYYSSGKYQLAMNKGNDFSPHMEPRP